VHVLGSSEDILALQYGIIQWPTKPDDPIARTRFAFIEETMRSLLEKGVFSVITSRRKVRILDVMAASGICGVALAKVLCEAGVDVNLVISDLRMDELELARQWIEVAGLKVENLSLRTIVADATKLPQYFKGEKFDIITVWGSSLPHLNVWELPLLISGARELQPPHGVLIMEQADILPRILVGNTFRYVMTEGKEALTIFESYDTLRGVQRRLLYKLPEMKYIGRVESRLWEVAQVLALMWLFYREVKLHDHKEVTGYISRITKVLVAKQPRMTCTKWEELAADLPRVKSVLHQHEVFLRR